MKILLSLFLLIPSLSQGNDKIYLNIKDFITYSISANKMMSLCKENHDYEMGKDIIFSTLYAASNEKLINEFQMNEIEASTLKTEEEAEETINVRCLRPGWPQEELYEMPEAR